MHESHEAEQREIDELTRLGVLDIGHSRVIEDEVMAILDGDPNEAQSAGLK